MEHRTVYAEHGMYAGWPANHGAWQWGDEFLVGFMRGPYKKYQSGHRLLFLWYRLPSTVRAQPHLTARSVWS